MGIALWLTATQACPTDQDDRRALLLYLIFGPSAWDQTSLERIKQKQEKAGDYHEWLKSSPSRKGKV